MRPIFSESRIVITTNTLDGGGAERQRVTLANELAALGHNVTIRCLQRKGPLAEDVSEQVNLEILGWRELDQRPALAVITGTTNTEVATGLTYKLGRNRAKWLIVVHNPVQPPAPKLSPFARRGLRFADSIAGLTEKHCDDLRKYWRLDTKVALGNGLTGVASTTTNAADEHIVYPEFDIGYLGRMSKEHKGLDRLFDALQVLRSKHYRVVLAGDGPDRTWAMERAKALPQHQFTFLTHAVPSKLLPQLKCLVMLSRYEAQPMVLMEAELANIAVLATRATGTEPSERVWILRDGATTNEVATSIIARVDRTWSGQSTRPQTARQMAIEYMNHIKSISPENSWS